VLRRFWPQLLATVHFDSTVPKDRLLDAITHLRRVEAGEAELADAPTGWIPASLRPLALDAEGKADRRGFALVVADQLRLSLGRRVMFVPAADRWGDPRKLLIQPAAWKRIGSAATRALQLPTEPPSWLERLGADLDSAWRRAASLVEADPSVWIEVGGRRDRVHLARLDAVDEPASLVELRGMVEALLPEVEIADLPLEVHGWTGFLDEYTHISGAPARAAGLVESLSATAYVQAALDHLAAAGHKINSADVARPSPLGHPTINLNGRYRTTGRAPNGGLRPLRRTG